MGNQGWKLLTVRLSGTGRNGGGQVKIFPKERQNSIELNVVHISRTGTNSGGQANILDTFPKERLIFFVISIPGNPNSDYAAISILKNKRLLVQLF